MKFKSFVYFILLNIFISAATTVTVLILWDRSHQSIITETGDLIPDFKLPTEVTESSNSDSPTGVRIYKILEGDTLEGIAQANQISVESLLSLNQDLDPEVILPGELIYLPPDSDTGTIAETEDIFPVGEEYPDQPTNNGLVEIVSVIGAGDLETERVYLRGLGEETLSLTGWRLIDEDNNQYIFPQLTLFSNGAVNIYTGSGVDTVVALYWNLSAPVWRPGENVVLLDSSGEIQATSIVP